MKKKEMILPLFAVMVMATVAVAQVGGTGDRFDGRGSCASGGAKSVGRQAAGVGRRHAVIPRGTSRIALSKGFSGEGFTTDKTANATSTILTVTNTNDSGPGSLRAAVAQSNGDVGATIRFDLAYPSTIELTSGEIVFESDVTLTGPGADMLTISGNGESRVFHVSEAKVTISGLSIVHGVSAGRGGGIYNEGTLTLVGCRVADCHSYGDGGGIENDSDLALENCDLTENSADLSGGGIYNCGQSLDILNSSLFFNESQFDGGGLYLLSGNCTLTNATLMTNYTLVGNGGGAWGDGSEAHLLNTIVAYSYVHWSSGSWGEDWFGTFYSEGHNLIWNTRGLGHVDGPATGDIYGVDPLLSYPDFNGGTTLTSVLQAGSPALDAGDDSVLGPPLNLATDQRGSGFPRKRGTHVDMGACESVPAPTVTTLAPLHGPASGGTEVTLSGQYFTGATRVGFGEQTASFTVDSDTQITAVSPPHAPGSVSVSVTTPYGTSGPTPADAFNYDCPSLELSPRSLPAAALDAPYSQTVSANGGTAPYTYALAGILPTGMSFSGDRLTGTPTETGTFDLVLTATDAAGCSASRSCSLVVPSLAVLVTGTPNNPATGVPVQFTAEASGGASPYSYSWDFGDGTSSAQESPSHEYTTAGTYRAHVSVTDAASNVVTSVDIVINVSGGDLGISLSATPLHGTAPLPVSFTPSVSGGNGPYTYSYDYGDASTGAQPDHTYSAPGTYSATVTVTDAASDTATSEPVTVNAWGPLTVAIDTAHTSGIAPFSTAFTSAVSGGSGSYVYRWDFGDGTMSSAAAPTKFFDSAGRFTVKLTVTDGASQTVVSNALDILVYDPLKVTVSVTPSTVVAGNPVTFSATVTGGSGTYQITWTFGDGESSSGATVERTYSSTGTHTIALTVADPVLDISVTKTFTVTVVPPPIAITSAFKKGAPFRIVILGSGFEDGCTATISGTPVRVKFKNSGKIVLKHCKKLCPKGVPVVIVITNPDGGATAPVPFTR